jgi:competence protein ComGC
MENASKALLIAGAVLIVIIIISIGILIVNAATDTTDLAQTNAAITSVQTFNNQFLPYEGKIKGSSVKTLEQMVTVSNANSEHTISVSYTGLTAGNAKNSTKYTVSFEYDTEGYISAITIKK